MRLRREQKFVAWAAAAAVIAVAAFLAGGALKPEEPRHYLFDLDAPAYKADVKAIAATSQGGFTGFGDTDNGNDRTVLGGRVVEVTATALTLETVQGSRTTLRLGPTSALSRLETGSSALIRPGATVLVKRAANPTDASAVLVLSQP
jgi:hypothetical protein